MHKNKLKKVLLVIDEKYETLSIYSCGFPWITIVIVYSQLASETQVSSKKRRAFPEMTWGNTSELNVKPTGNEAISGTRKSFYIKEC